jgi:hypothetical protein
MQVAKAGLSQLARGALTVNIFCCDLFLMDREREKTAISEKLTRCRQLAKGFQ